MTYVNSEAIDWAFERDVSTSSNKFVLVAIAKHVNRHWAGFPSKAEIARMTKLSEVTVAKCLRELEEDGHMLRVPFVASNGQDQKPGFILAGCGRPLSEIDTDFLTAAFAHRKHAGVPQVAKPQHWSGERKGEGIGNRTLPGYRKPHPEGVGNRTPRRKEQGEDQKGQEEGTAAQAPDKSGASSRASAIAEVRADAPTPASRTTTQDTPKTSKRRTYPSNQKRNDDWRAQIAAADLAELGNILADNPHGEAASRLACYRLGINRDQDVPDTLWPQFVQHAYLYLLKDVAASDENHLDPLLYPLDANIRAGKPGTKWDESVWTPAGETAASFGTRMQQVARSMPPEQVGPWMGEFDDFRPQICYDARQRAREYLKAHGMPLEVETIGVQAMQYVIEHYTETGGGKWPMEAVPPPMCPTAAIEPPAWAA